MHLSDQFPFSFFGVLSVLLARLLFLPDSMVSAYKNSSTCLSSLFGDIAASSDTQKIYKISYMWVNNNIQIINLFLTIVKCIIWAFQFRWWGTFLYFFHVDILHFVGWGTWEVLGGNEIVSPAPPWLVTLSSVTGDLTHGYNSTHRN